MSQGITAAQLKGATVTLRSVAGVTALQFCSPSVVRVHAVAPGATPKLESLSVVKRNLAPVAPVLKGTGKGWEVATKAMRVQIEQGSGALAFADSDGTVLVRETGRALTPASVLGEQTFHVEAAFALGPDDALYGLGQHQHGALNQRGRKLLLAQDNTEVALPVMVSNRGWGIFWDNMSETVVNDTGKDRGEPLRIWSEVGEAVDYYVIAGPALDDIVAAYRGLTGAAPLFPKWAYGFFQSKERYQSQQEILEIVGEHRARGIPLDCIVQDWRYWDPHEWGAHLLDQGRYPDPAGMMKELHEKLHCAMIISVWGRFRRSSENYEQMRNAGNLCKEYQTNTPADWPWQEHPNPEAYYDPFKPEARAMYWAQMNNILFTKGIDGWWLDATEPELDPFMSPHFWRVAAGRTPPDTREAIKRHMSGVLSGARTRNAFPLMTTKAVYEGQRAFTSGKRVYILTRSAFAGQQRHAATVWSGDIEGEWDVLRKQIPAGLNFCASGQPYWTTDIGGFFVNKYKEGCKDPGYRELYARWFQFGAFCPVFRSHGTSTPREAWRFGDPGEEAYDAILRASRLRYRLFPHVYSLAWQVTNAGGTIMRALAFDFPGDRRAADICDQYLFGREFLVCPVTQPGATTRRVYLPAGVKWYDFWTGELKEGGKEITADAPLARMPLFVREGSIVPMGPEIQYADEKPADPVELRVYTGANAARTLYEDRGDTYAYESGERATIPVRWSERAATLTIGDRKGEFPGMLASRTFRVVFVRPGHGTGEGVTKSVDATVRYSGKRVEVKSRAAGRRR